MFVRDVLRSKAAQVWTIGPEATVYSALELMSEKNVGALPVMKGDDVVGMFSERDYARKVTLLGKSARATTVGELMSQPVICVEPDATVDHCMELMTDSPRPPSAGGRRGQTRRAGKQR